MHKHHTEKTEDKLEEPFPHLKFTFHFPSYQLTTHDQGLTFNKGADPCLAEWLSGFSSGSAKHGLTS